MKAKDFLTDEDADLRIANGDFVVGDSDEQHIEDILVSSPGSWKQSPLLGVSLPDYFGAPNSAEMANRLRRAFQLNLESDGYRVDDITMTGGVQNMEVTAERIK